MTEQQQIVRTHEFLCRGLVIIVVIWILGLVALYVSETHQEHGHAVYLPGGIEVYP